MWNNAISAGFGLLLFRGDLPLLFFFTQVALHHNLLIFVCFVIILNRRFVDCMLTYVCQTVCIFHVQGLCTQAFFDMPFWVLV